MSTIRVIPEIKALDFASREALSRIGVQSSKQKKTCCSSTEDI
jgi:hypothetical protein